MMTIRTLLDARSEQSTSSRHVVSRQTRIVSWVALAAAMLVLTPATALSSHFGIGTAENTEVVFGGSGFVTVTLTLGLSGGGTAIVSTGVGEFDPGIRNQGWWSATFINSNFNDNYGVGDDSNDGSVLVNNFFTFDISSLNPTPEIISATLDVQRFIGFSDLGETSFLYSIFDVSTDAAVLNFNNGTNATIFADLASGTFYGAHSITVAGVSTEILHLDLNANAVADINFAIGAAEPYFSIGGTIGLGDIIIDESIVLAPLTATNPVGTNHTVVATLVDELTSLPVVGRLVDFEVISGPSSGTTGSDTSDANGDASFTFSSLVAGTDVIEARFVDSAGIPQISDDTVEKIWVEGDRDGDGVVDDVDNCPDIPNLGQENDDPCDDENICVVGEPDSHGDACDNCPTIWNEDQLDVDPANGVGDACDQGQILDTAAPMDPVIPGDPTEFLVCRLVNEGDQPLRIPRPNCSLCNFEATASLSGPVPPRFRMPKGFVIPDDIFTLPSMDPAAPGINEFEVKCAISELWAPENLPPGEQIDFVATYSTQGIKDPDIDPDTGVCDPNVSECFTVDDFQVQAAVGSFPVADTTPVVTHEAVSCSVDPPIWVQQWEAVGGPIVSTTMVFDAAVDPMNIVVDSVRLQFVEPTLPGTESFPNNSLTVGFDGGSAMAALGGTAPGTLFTATVTGEIAFVENEVLVMEFFTANCPIPIAAATVVSIDIKPGSFPNSINLSSNGGVPVAIFSTDSFDATQVDASTVSLAGSMVQVRGKGNKLLSSPEDVNGDGLMDLVVHVDTTALELTGQDTQAVLEGMTFDGLRIIGSDTIRVVQE